MICKCLAKAVSWIIVPSLALSVAVAVVGTADAVENPAKDYFDATTFGTEADGKRTIPPQSRRRWMRRQSKAAWSYSLPASIWSPEA